MNSLRFTPVLAAAIAAASLTAAPAASQASVGALAPTVTTGSARVLTGPTSSTVLTGAVNGHGLRTEYFFEYGGTSYGSTTKPELCTVACEHSATEKVSVKVPGSLVWDHYRLVATNAEGTRHGRDRTVEPAKVKQTKTKTKTKSKKLAFDLPHSFQPTVIGEPFVFSGTLTGAGDDNREVVLQQSPYPYSAAFTDVGAPVLTRGLGAFSFRVPHLTRTTRFRVGLVGSGLISDILTQLVQVRVTLNVHASKLVKGLVRLYGTVSPAIKTGTRVLFQLEQAPKARSLKTERPQKESKLEAEQERPPIFATRFDTVVKHAAKSFSRFSLVVKVTTSGNYRALVQMPAGPLASGESETVALHAGQTKKKKRKG